MSDVARFREQQALEQQSSEQGLSGPAVMSNHDAINARMNQAARTLNALYAAGRNQEADDLWDAGIMVTGVVQ